MKVYLESSIARVDHDTLLRGWHDLDDDFAKKLIKADMAVTEKDYKGHEKAVKDADQIQQKFQAEIKKKLEEKRAKQEKKDTTGDIPSPKVTTTSSSKLVVR